MLEKIDLEKIINDPSYGEEEPKRFSRDIMKSLTIQGYDELVDIWIHPIYQAHLFLS